jgi:peroxiredoxin
MGRLHLGAFPLLAAGLAAGAEFPRPAPALEFVSHQGVKVNLADYRGKVVIVEFMLTYCPSCVDSARLLSKLQSEYGPRGFQVLGVAVNDNAAAGMLEFVRKTQVNFPVGIKQHGFAQEFLQFPVMVRMTMPQLAIIDRKGQIREQHNPMETAWWSQEEKNLRAVIEKLLAEGARPAGKKRAVPKK